MKVISPDNKNISLITCNLTARQADWVPSESINDYFIKIYRMDVPKLCIGYIEDSEVWLVRIFNPIQETENTYIHYLEIDGKRCRTVKKYELILQETPVSRNLTSPPSTGIMHKRLICSNIIKICGFLSAEFQCGDNNDLYYSTGVYMFHFHFDIDGFLVKMEQEII